MEGVEVRLIRLRSTVAITTALSAQDFPSQVSSCGKSPQLGKSRKQHKQHHCPASSTRVATASLSILEVLIITDIGVINCRAASFIWSSLDT